MFINCDGSYTSNQTTPPPKGGLAVGYVRTYLTECESFFAPPLEGTDGTIKNQSGAVAWTSCGFVGDPEILLTKDQYKQRLNKATKANQENRSQYSCTSISSDCGWPGFDDGIANIPGKTLQAGFVCWALVYRAIKSVGAHDPWPGFIPGGCDNLLASSYISEIDLTTEMPRIGDIVAFDFKNDGDYEHLGILVSISGNITNKNNWKMVSSIGIVEIFQFGAKETCIRLTKLWCGRRV